MFGYKKITALMDGYLCRHLPIFPCRHQQSIFGTIELNFRVRYGNGCTHQLFCRNSCDFEIIAYTFQKCKLFFGIYIYNLYLIYEIKRKVKYDFTLRFEFSIFCFGFSDGICTISFDFNAVHVVVKGVFTVNFKVFLERAK